MELTLEELVNEDDDDDDPSQEATHKVLNVNDMSNMLSNIPPSNRFPGVSP